MVRRILLSGISMALFTACATASNIVENGGFTTGNITDWTTQVCSVCAGQPWGVGTFPANPGMLPPDTTFAATLGCNHGPCINPVSGESITQSLATVPFDTYTLTFFYDPGKRSDTELEVLWDGSVVTNGQIINAPGNTWEEYVFPGLTASAVSTALEFTGRDNRGTLLYLTDVSVISAIPEPAPLLLMVSGLLVLGTKLRRAPKA